MIARTTIGRLPRAGTIVIPRRYPGLMVAAVAAGELIINGSFASDSAWDKGLNWTIAVGVAQRTAVASESWISQPVAFVAGGVYRARFDLMSSNGEPIGCRFIGGTAVPGAQRFVPGTYSEDLTAAAGNIAFAIVAYADFAGAVDNVSLRRIA